MIKPNADSPDIAGSSGRSVSKKFLQNRRIDSLMARNDKNNCLTGLLTQNKEEHNANHVG